MKKIIKIISISLLLLSSNFLNLVYANEKIKIGLLVPMTGENKDLDLYFLQSSEPTVQFLFFHWHKLNLRSLRTREVKK